MYSESFSSWSSPVRATYARRSAREIESMLASMRGTGEMLKTRSKKPCTFFSARAAEMAALAAKKALAKAEQEAKKAKRDLKEARAALKGVEEDRC